LTHIIISAFEEYDGLRGLYLPVVPSTVRLWNLAREHMRGRPAIGIVAGTESKSMYRTYSSIVAQSYRGFG
jgi:hypothetical protein